MPAGSRFPCRWCARWAACPCIQDGSQFLIATHSPILMAYPNAVIYECGAHGIGKVQYEDTEHYRVMHDFIANPQRMLKVLLAP